MVASAPQQWLQQLADKHNEQQWCQRLLPAVFLERYSSLLSSSDLDSFQPLRSNYEVNYWLNQAEQQQQQQRRQSGSGPYPAPDPEQQQHAADCGSSRNKAASKTAANRRLAFMYKLEQQGEYFSESSMRAREPLVWHEYIGEAWSTIIRLYCAAVLYRCRVVGHLWVGQIGDGQLQPAVLVRVLHASSK
jgi:hypothetical protein